MSVSDEQVRDAIRGLLQKREPPATICPSEAARALDPQGWRPLMPQVRAVALALASQGSVEVRQGGRAVEPDGSLRGPIRIGRAMPHTNDPPTTPDGRYFVVNGRLARADPE